MESKIETKVESTPIRRLKDAINWELLGIKSVTAQSYLLREISRYCLEMEAKIQ